MVQCKYILVQGFILKCRRLTTKQAKIIIYYISTWLVLHEIVFSYFTGLWNITKIELQISWKFQCRIFVELTTSFVNTINAYIFIKFSTIYTNWSIAHRSQWISSKFDIRENLLWKMLPENSHIIRKLPEKPESS